MFPSFLPSKIILYKDIEFIHVYYYGYLKFILNLRLFTIMLFI